MLLRKVYIYDCPGSDVAVDDTDKRSMGEVESSEHGQTQLGEVYFSSL